MVGNPDDKKMPNEPTGLANTLVELTRDQEVLRTVTDYNGKFLFEGLQPGEWHLKIYDYHLPAYHYLETPEQDITLQSEENDEVTIRVLPRTRAIKVIDEASLQTNGPQE